MTDEQQPEPRWLQTLREMTKCGGPWFAKTIREVATSAVAEINLLQSEVTRLGELIDEVHAILYNASKLTSADKESDVLAMRTGLRESLAILHEEIIRENDSEEATP